MDEKIHPVWDDPDLDPRLREEHLRNIQFTLVLGAFLGFMIGATFTSLLWVLSAL